MTYSSIIGLLLTAIGLLLFILQEPDYTYKEFYIAAMLGLGIGLLIGGFAIANYLLVYARAGIGLDHPHPPLDIVAEATTVTYVTVVFCQLINIIQRRNSGGFFSRYQLHNRVFWSSIVLSLGIVMAISYVPTVSLFFKSGPLGPLDWLSVLVAASVFLVVREAQRILKKQNFRYLSYRNFQLQ